MFRLTIAARPGVIGSREAAVTRAFWGRPDPTDPARQQPPALHEQSSGEDPLYEPRGRGGGGGAGGAATLVVEPTVPHPGGSLAPEPGEELERRAPIVKVTTDRDVVDPPEEPARSARS
ncbi:hypothetical protein Rsub_06398 [Raphidocelis subcapitata]|uniref:Uncharacterized protein n=1 Tax=Raphidocelis subcapitata TaxID=307507 RepID=A0A2V0P678_9CHLO|nr:hypothetical protein Rsub_06398 [Raphidocelis subcapitata]|eukprot:GBF93360.1 hypothetical protein Rsub_06398 [Raphidocelis subcapitata]